MKKEIQLMLRARYTMHQRLDNQGYVLEDKGDHSKALATSFEAFRDRYSHLDLCDVEQLSDMYYRYEDLAKRAYVYTTYNAFNKDHVTMLLHNMVMDNAEYHIISWTGPRPGDIPWLKDFNNGRPVEFYHVMKLQANFGDHLFSPLYELVPTDDVCEVLENLGISSTSSLPKILSCDSQIQILGYSCYVGSIVRVVNQGSVSYSLIVRGQKERDETRSL